MIKSSIDKLLKYFGAVIDDLFSDFEIPDRVVPNRFAPIIVLDNDKVSLKPMRFSLLPSWSKEPKVKFATHNARIEGIESKPTWKRPFIHNHCLVPLTHFIEPIYEGDYAGNMVAFSDAADDRSLLVAAGIFDRWSDGQNSIESFAIITTTPQDFVRQTGHDRQPLFVKEKFLNHWLNNTGKPPQSIAEELRSFEAKPALKAAIDRQLKKRVK